MSDWKKIRKSKDLWSGLIFFCFGAIFVYFGRKYPMGTAMRMGPAYFPTVLGGLLAFIGIILITKTLFKPGLPVDTMRYSKIFFITTSNILFALMFRRIGLVISLILLVLIGAFASQRFRWGYAISLAIGLAIGSTIIFVLLLHLPMPIVGSWFGG